MYSCRVTWEIRGRSNWLRADQQRVALLVGGLFVSCCLIAFSPASAKADAPVLPIYDGTMTFPQIGGPSDPEEFSWEVTLGEGQELEFLDEQHAAVFYTEGHHLAFGITVTLAHDALGANVPTTLSVSGGNIITLSVHHRAGNPAIGGAPFVYPIMAGGGWEGGFSTVIVDTPPDEQELREQRERAEREEAEAVRRLQASEGCLVPRLKGRSLRAAKKRLKTANCKIGKVQRLKGATARSGKVVKQSPRPSVMLGSATTVDVMLGQ